MQRDIIQQFSRELEVVKDMVNSGLVPDKAFSSASVAFERHALFQGAGTVLAHSVVHTQ
jgi:hypothetical protein